MATQSLPTIATQAPPSISELEIHNQIRLRVDRTYRERRRLQLLAVFIPLMMMLKLTMAVYVRGEA